MTTVVTLPPEAVEAGPTEFLRSIVGHVVYFLFEGEECVYVGQTRRFRGRMRHHAKRKVFDSVMYMHVPSCDALRIEAEYIELIRPRLNAARGVGAADGSRRHTHVRARQTTVDKLRLLARRADVSMVDLMTQLVDRYGPKEAERLRAERNGKSRRESA